MIRVEGGNRGLDRRPMADEVDDDAYEPGRGLVLALLSVAGVAATLAALPAAIARARFRRVLTSWPSAFRAWLRFLLGSYFGAHSGSGHVPGRR